MNTSIKIKASFITLSEAVQFSGMDLSYNLHAALEKIADLDRPNRHGKVSAVYVTDMDEVLYVYDCDLRILNKFEPFHSMMDDCPFLPVVINEEAKTIEIHNEIKLPRSARRTIAKAGLIVTTLSR